MKIKKLSFFLLTVSALILMIAATSLCASAEEVTYRFLGGEFYFDTETGTITGCIGSKDGAVLEIPEEINGVKVVAIANKAFAFSSSGARLWIDRLTIPGTVKKIGDKAFYNTCIRELTLGEGIEFIGDSAFESANELATLSIPESVKRIGSRAFSDCSWLETVTYYSHTSVADDAFVRCSNYLDITVLDSSIPAYSYPAVSTNGLKITVSNLAGVKDYFIAKGTYNTYRELKPYYVMRVTENKIKGANSYTYTVTEQGDYTICVRFNDGSENLMLYTTAKVTPPKFSVKGTSITVSRLSNLIVLRAAPGVWNTPGEVKRAPGARNIPVRNISGNEYVLNFTENGSYTVTLEYSNGLVVVEHFELTRIVPIPELQGNVLTISNVEELYTLRYAMGEYSTMGEIKRAEGCQVRRNRDVQNGSLTVRNLKSGTYTFCVQYTDNSYHYFTVVVE